MTLTDGILSVFCVASIAMPAVVIVAQMRTIRELLKEVKQLQQSLAKQAAKARRALRSFDRELHAGGTLVSEITGAIERFNRSQDIEEDRAEDQDE